MELELEEIKSILNDMKSDLLEIKLRLEMEDARKRNEFLRRGILFPFVPEQIQSNRKMRLDKTMEKKPVSQL